MKKNSRKILISSLVVFWIISFFFALMPNKLEMVALAENPSFCSNNTPPILSPVLRNKSLYIEIGPNLSDKEFLYSLFVYKKETNMAGTPVASIENVKLSAKYAQKTIVSSLSVTDEGDYVLKYVFEISGSVCAYSNTWAFNYKRPDFNPNCPAAKLLDISANFGSSSKVFVGQTFSFSLKQPSDTDYKVGATFPSEKYGPITLVSDDILYLYRVYYSLQSESTGWKLLTGNGILVGHDDTTEQRIPTLAPGKYNLRFVVDDQIRECLNLQTVDIPFEVAGTKGIVINSSKTSATVGESIGLSAKFYGLTGQKFVLYVDDQQKTEGTITAENTPLPNPVYNWDTSGTAPGNHEIKFKVYPGIDGTDNNKTITSITITEPGATPPGGSATGGRNLSLTDLNRYNIATLLGSCGTSNLDSILCMVETVIDWLLDIGAVISFIMILYASAIYLTSYGDESKAELAKKTLIWSAIGVIVISVAMVVMKIIENTLNNPSSLN